MQEFDPNNPLIDTPKRPVFLTVLCILTFIWSGLSLFSNFFVAVLYDFYVQFLGTQESGVFEELFYLIAESDRIMFFANGFLFLGSIIGAVFMFRLKKIGFHIYTISNLVILFTPMIFAGASSINFSELFLVTLPFILMYFLNFKHMK